MLETVGGEQKRHLPLGHPVAHEAAREDLSEEFSDWPVRRLACEETVFVQFRKVILEPGRLRRRARTVEALQYDEPVGITPHTLLPRLSGVFVPPCDKYHNGREGGKR